MYSYNYAHGKVIRVKRSIPFKDNKYGSVTSIAFVLISGCAYGAIEGQ